MASYALANSTVATAEPPHLVTATSTYTDTFVREATYYFTIAVPASAGKPLQQVNFTQKQGLEQIQFDGKDSRAFEGTPNRKGQKLAFQLTRSDKQKDTVTVIFDQPIQPGQTVTIGLKPYRNPSYEGVYLFQLTGFFSRQQGDSQYLGTGRLQFYRSE
ncbi:DUF2808 domain-containing protein [Scytonema sp. NUACC21]